MTSDTPVFRLATLRHGGAAVPVIQVGESCWRLDQAAPGLFAPGAPASLMALFLDWERACETLSDWARCPERHPPALAASVPPDQYLTPLQYPAKALFTGTNYLDHVHSIGHGTFNKSDNFPAFFLKPPTTTLVGPGATVSYPEQSSKLDWEVELAVIVGKRMRRVPASAAMAHVAAYSIGIDLSARDVQNNPKHYVGKDLCLGKAFDHSCPLGPTLTPACFVGDPQSLDLELSVNGELKQSSNTRNMIWSVAEQLEELSRHITLEPGDVLMTGTPGGCGYETGQFLKPGDRISARIAGLGQLEVDILPPDPPSTDRRA